MQDMEERLQTAADLKAARELIRRGWCRGTYATTAGSAVVDATEPEAARFCAVGALERAIRGVRPFPQRAPKGRTERAVEALAAGITARWQREHPREGGLPGFLVTARNDSYRRQAAVLAWFDRAIHHVLGEKP